MKLASVKGKGPDGRLVVVSRDLKLMAPADHIAPTLQTALDGWPSVESRLADLYKALNAGRAAAAKAFRPQDALAPLPRAWQWLDGSAFEAHSSLATRAYQLANTWGPTPLMYQGMSHRFLSSTEDVPFPPDADGIDFEGEFGVITDAVPMGCTADDALGRIRLVVQINDWSLRALGREEMKTGFGWIQGKPACSVAPVAVTPDELGDAWKNGRVGLALNVWRGEELFGWASGSQMGFGFHELIAHAAYSRDLSAGTIIGSGTVANWNHDVVGSSCILERRGIEILKSGGPATPFLRFGERVRMQAKTANDEAPFGVIDQRVGRI